MDKHRLKAYREMKQEADQLQRMQNDLRCTVASLQARGCMAERLKDLSDRVDRLLAEKRMRLLAELEEIERAIDALESRERLILRDHYINGLTWEEVSCRRHYSLQHVHRIHAEALKNLK